ncbi:MAG: hypothetical protein ACRD6X_18395 [Pyrinomonadaceae bacterium]
MLSLKLSNIPLGGRLMVRSRVDWRTAVVSRISEDGITLSVASPKGRNYRLRRDPCHEVGNVNGLYVLHSETSEQWNDNFAAYDIRW